MIDQDIMERTRLGRRVQGEYRFSIHSENMRIRLVRVSRERRSTYIIGR